MKKYLNRYLFVFSVLTTLTFLLSTRVTVGGGVWGNSEENYMRNFNGLKSVAAGFIVFVFSYMIFYYADRFLNRIICYFSSSQYQQNTYKLQIIYPLVNIVAWIPYYLSYYPGGIYADTFASVSFFYNNLVTNRHPVLYTFLLGRFICLSELLNKDLTWAFGTFTLVQMIMGIILLQFFLKTLIRYKIHTTLIHMIMLLFIFYPLIPLYHISVWKDTPFALSFLWWFIAYVDVLNEVKKDRLKTSLVIHFILGALLVAFTRNNGIYIVLPAVVCLLIYLHSASFSGKRGFYIISILTIIMIPLIQGPVYNILGVQKTDTVENYGIPMQQIGAVVANHGIISEEEKEEINKFIPIDRIEEYFSPCLADNLKWYGGFRNGYLRIHQKDFLLLWARLFQHNKTIYIKQYLLSTVGFWDVDNNGSDAYVMRRVWDNDYGVSQNDLFQKLFGFSFQHYVNPRYYISGAWFFWLFVASAFFCMRHYGFRNLIYFVPPLMLWCTVMVAAPIAWSLRYVAGLLFTIPYAFLIPVFLEMERKNGNSV